MALPTFGVTTNANGQMSTTDTTGVAETAEQKLHRTKQELRDALSGKTKLVQDNWGKEKEETSGPKVEIVQSPNSDWLININYGASDAWPKQLTGLEYVSVLDSFGDLLPGIYRVNSLNWNFIQRYKVIL